MLALLRLLGLFDRPATADCLKALWQEPAIPGLTDPLVQSDEAHRNSAVKRLESAKLLTVNRDASGALISLDAHPHIREYFAKQLREQNLDAWRAGHRRLYEHLCEIAPKCTRVGPLKQLMWQLGMSAPEATLEDLQPLYQAVAHGCQAGLQQESNDKVFFARIKNSNEFHSTKKLGAFGSDLGATACFFESRWIRVSPVLARSTQAVLLNYAAFCLRALGQLTEALKPMRAGMEARLKMEQFDQAAISASNLSELELTLGDVAAAVDDAEQSVTYAYRSGDRRELLEDITTHADALHQAGHPDEALERFHEAEQMQQDLQPDYRLLYSLQGFRYCDLLLADSERAAWQVLVVLGSQQSAFSSVEACCDVSQRAALTLKWATEGRLSLLTVALDHLTLGRAALYEEILANAVGGTRNAEWQTASHELEDAVSGLRRAGQQQYLPLGLLTRAWLRFLDCEPTDRQSAQEDLDEAWEIAERGPMRLFMADIRLYRARLFFREEEYPKEWISPKTDLDAARKLIEQCGYWRRKEELEDAEEAVRQQGT